MKFLSVLCALLYFQSGDLFQIHNDALQYQYQNQGHIQSDSQRNIVLGSLNNGYNIVRESQINSRSQGKVNSPRSQQNLRFGPSQVSPEYINSQQFKYVNERPLNQELRSAYINSQKLHSANAEERKFIDGEVDYRAKSNLESSLHYVHPKHNPKIQSHLTYPKNINTQSINIGNLAPLTANEDAKLELQGIPPELIESMINQNNIKQKTIDSAQPLVSLPNSYENIRNTEDRKPFNEYRLHQDNAKFQSPSAEVLYDMKQALPYNIRSQQPPSILEDDVNFKNNVPNARKIEDIIRSTTPIKLYTIIYPSGRVEHADDIEKITKIYPNYVMIKSQDVIDHLNGKITIPGLQIPLPKVTLPINNYQKVTSINQNQTPVQYSTVEKHIDKVLPSQILSKPIISKDTVTEVSIVSSKANVMPSKTPPAVDVANKNAMNSPNNNSQSGINKLSSKEISLNVTSAVSSTIIRKGSNLKSKLTITHSAPIIKTQEISNIERPALNFTDILPVLNHQNFSSDIALTTESSKNGSTIISTTSTTNITTSIITEKSDKIRNQTQVEKTKFMISANSTNEPQNKDDFTSDENSEYGPSSLNKPVPETASVYQFNNDNTTMSETSTTRADNSTKGFKNDIGLLNQTRYNTIINTTGPDNLALLDINDNIAKTNETDISSQAPVSSIAYNNINETEIKPLNEKFSTNTNTTMSEISTESKNVTLSSANVSNSSKLWFQADDLFWRNIANSNDAQNMFYFLFIPPKPSVIKKETKTTIYANGTTVEEISEIRDEDGVPTVVRTTKISYANSSSTDL